MDESRGTLKTALQMRTAYNTVPRGEFVKYACHAFGVDLFTAEMIWETITAVSELGVTDRPSESHALMMEKGK